MRFLMVFALLVLAQPALAGDDFGSRFGSNASVGFEDVTTDPEKALSEIAPAAGDEQEPAADDETINAEQDEKADPEGDTYLREQR